MGEEIRLAAGDTEDHVSCHSAVAHLWVPMLLPRCRQFLGLTRRRGTDMLSQVLGSRAIGAIVGPRGYVSN